MPAWISRFSGIVTPALKDKPQFLAAWVCTCSAYCSAGRPGKCPLKTALNQAERTKDPLRQIWRAMISAVANRTIL